MVKILVADSIPGFCSAVADSFEGKYTVLTCSDGRTALRLLCEEKPDVLWLDVMLPRLDGLTILQSAAFQGITPLVIACIRSDSDYVLNALEKYAVHMVMQKPCELTAAMARIAALAVQVEQKQGSAFETMDQLTYEILLLLGLIGNRRCHKYLFSALRRRVLDPDCQITKILYPDVAEEFHSNVQSVERAIRGLLKETWEKEHSAEWDLFFPDYPDKWPSNSVFLDRVSEKIRNLLKNSEK